MIHNTADVSPKAIIGENTRIWHQVQVREDARIGKNCILAKNVYIDLGVKIGDNVKIQNNASVYRGTIVEEGVFIGPHVCITNDRNPRAINPDGNIKTANDWEVSQVLIKKGASIGAGSVILPGIKIGKFAMIGAGSVVTKDVPDYGLFYGNPAKLYGYVCKCGKNIEQKCPVCGVSLTRK